MKSYLNTASAVAGSIVGAAPGVLGSNESELTGTITALLPTIITFIIVVMILSVLVGIFNQMGR